MKSNRQQRSDQDASLAPKERYLAAVWRGWRHDRGVEAVEFLALIAIILALLAAISLAFRDRAAAIGEAAIATFTRWLSGAPAGGAGGIAAPQVTAFPHTVVSLPQLLGSMADAAPWAERALGVAGSLLVGSVVWVALAQPASQRASASWVSQLGDALRWMGEQAAGVVVGVFEGVYDMTWLRGWPPSSSISSN